MLIYGLNTINLISSPYSNSIVFALDATTGAVLWQTAPLDSHLASVITGAGRYDPDHDQVIFGVSSNEETFDYPSGYNCCSFRGSVVAIDLKTQTINWKVYTTGSAPGAKNGTLLFPGAAIWSGSFPIDRQRKMVYVATGNSYDVDPRLESCVENVATVCPATNGTCITLENQKCFHQFDRPDNHAESLMAIDTATGKLLYATKLTEEIGWTLACFKGAGVNACPSTPGTDADFGQSPMLMTLPNGRQVLILLQKSGFLYVMDRDDGQVVHAAWLTPGGLTGGFQWGSAFDRNKVYALGTNSLYQPDVMTTGQTINYGSFLAYDVLHKQLDYHLPEPNFVSHVLVSGTTQIYSRPMGQVAVTPDLFALTSNSGFVYLVDRRTGSLLWQANALGSSISTGVEFRRNCLFVTTGYIYLNVNATQVPRTVCYCLSDARHQRGADDD